MTGVVSGFLQSGQRLFITLPNGDLFDVTDEMVVATQLQDRVIEDLAAALKQVITAVEDADDCTDFTCLGKAIYKIDGIASDALAKVTL